MSDAVTTEMPVKHGRGRPKKKPGEPSSAPQKFIDIDRLPDSAVLRAKEVTQLLGCSQSTIWRYVRTGKLAAPVKIGLHMTGWRVGAIRAFLEGAPVITEACERVKSIVEAKQEKRRQSGIDQQIADVVKAPPTFTQDVVQPVADVKYFPSDRIEAARDVRAKGRLERLHRMTEAQAEAKAIPEALTHHTVEYIVDRFYFLFPSGQAITGETDVEVMVELVRVWFRSLSPLTDQDALAAARLWCSIGHRFPTPADLLDCAKTLRAVKAIWPDVHFPPLT